MRIRIYRNKKNPHKYIEVKEYICHHYAWREYLEWKSTGVRNYTGDGCFHRQSKKVIREVLLDYILVY